MFLSYCSLHSSHRGGLASVRMELILLLQESQQDDHVQTAVASYLHHASIPLLLACTASAKTVVTNPIVYLTNLTHDILQTINALDSPPHPDVINNKINVMHTLAASLSACVYQWLCDGHNYSDDFLVIHARDDFNTLHSTTPYTHSSPGTPINMPWVGSLQTGRDAAVVRHMVPLLWFLVFTTDIQCNTMQ
uniref:Uncharacterized protein n=1 Tax=Hucho hucho TaxID=62062 RepID=A0A4W5K733_9TELE